MFNFHPNHSALSDLLLFCKCKSPGNTKLIPLNYDYNSESIEEKHTAYLLSKDNKRKKKINLAFAPRGEKKKKSFRAASSGFL